MGECLCIILASILLHKFPIQLYKTIKCDKMITLRQEFSVKELFLFSSNRNFVFLILYFICKIRKTFRIKVKQTKRTTC